ncbi:MAG: glycosyltransferase [Caldilineaceae bacterium]|nr:glycosyltransferase [Caldilineaceae bacterium]
MKDSVHKNMTEIPTPRAIFLAMPYAPGAIITHTEKIIQSCMANCQSVRVLCDSRVDFAKFDAHVTHYANLPVLHHVESIRPRLWSALLWIFKLCWILIQSCVAVIANRHQTDVVVCFASHFHLPVLVCGRMCGLRTVLFDPSNSVLANHIVYGQRPWGRIWLRLLHLLRRLNHGIAHVLVQESWYEIKQAGLDMYRSKVSLGSIYTDTDFYRETIPWNDRAPIVGFIGRFTPEKGLMPFIEAAVMLKNQNLAFHIVGDGPQRAEVESLIQRHNGTQIKLTGWACPTEVVTYFNQFRLYVMPSLAEGMPVAAREAMACGTPVLVTNVGGVSDIIEDGKTGFILKDLEPATIAQAIMDALSHPQLAEIAQKGRNHVVQTFSLQPSIRQWQHILIGQ